MKKIIGKLLFLLLLSLLQTGSIQAQVTVVDSQTAAQLVQKIIGRGVTVLNANLTCPGAANGYFRITGPNDLGLDSGIILTTGRVKARGNFIGAFGTRPGTLPGPDFFNNGDTADSDLKPLVGNVRIRDVCKLELDFIPVGNTLSFDYIFASSEYRMFSCSDYNDVFGFFLSGPGFAGTTNLATIPNTSIPVTVNSTTDTTINTTSNTRPCTIMGPGAPFSQYYVDNRNGTTVTYWGFTKTLTARAALIPCQQYHMKMAIADVTDGLLDSGTFLKAGSFSSDSIITTSRWDTSFCYKGRFPGITLAASPDYTRRRWNDGDTSRLHVIHASGTYWARSADCTVHTDTFHVQGYPAPDAFTLGPDTVICAGNTSLVLHAPDAAGLTYRWQDNTSLQSMPVTHAGIYFLTLSSGQCSTTDTILISDRICSCNSIMPNAFTPNGDGLNDRIMARLSPDCLPAKTFVLQIYDRWGRRVYAAYNPGEAGWNGYYQNRPCEAGTYFYELKFKGRETDQETFEKGDITLVR